MDALLKLFDKYRGHLKRESLSMGDFLEANYREYIDDVRVAMSPEDNPLLGDNICSMVENHISAIIENSKKLVEVHKLFEHGRIMEASNTAFEVFSSMKPQLMHRYSGAFRQEMYYRIRSISDGSTFPLERKELFHIPYKKNYLVGTERYSMPGHPCLYLASQAELGWFECRKPTKFAIAKFAIPQDEDRYLKYIDFSEKLMPLKHSFFCWFHNEENKNSLNNYFLKYICTYPLRAACSVVVEHPGGKFIEEYIIPQLLLQWVLKDADFDGIRYESCSESNEVKSFGGHNIVLVTKEFDSDGYDIKLRDCIKIGLPSAFDVNKITCDSDLLVGKDIKEEPFYWNMDEISSDFQNQSFISTESIWQNGISYKNKIYVLELLQAISEKGYVEACDKPNNSKYRKLH